MRNTDTHVDVERVLQLVHTGLQVTAANVGGQYAEAAVDQEGGWVALDAVYNRWGVGGAGWGCVMDGTAVLGEGTGGGGVREGEKHEGSGVSTAL